MRCLPFQKGREECDCVSESARIEENLPDRSRLLPSYTHCRRKLPLDLTAETAARSPPSGSSSLLGPAGLTKVQIDGPSVCLSVGLFVRRLPIELGLERYLGLRDVKILF